MSRGRFSLARAYLRSALENTPLVPALVTSLVQLPAGDAAMLWGNLRVWTLRKSLVCARAVGDTFDYVSLCLSLLEPGCAHHISLELRRELQRDLKVLASSISPYLSGTDADADRSGSPLGVGSYSYPNKSSSSLFSRNEIVVDAGKHFKTTLHVNHQPGVQADEAITAFPVMTVSNATKLIHDESYKVGWCGRIYTISQSCSLRFG